MLLFSSSHRYFSTPAYFSLLASLMKYYFTRSCRCEKQQLSSQFPGDCFCHKGLRLSPVNVYSFTSGAFALYIYFFYVFYIEYNLSIFSPDLSILCSMLTTENQFLIFTKLIPSSFPKISTLELSEIMRALNPSSSLSKLLKLYNPTTSLRAQIAPYSPRNSSTSAGASLSTKFLIIWVCQALDRTIVVSPLLLWESDMSMCMMACYQLSWLCSGRQSVVIF